MSENLINYSPIKEEDLNKVHYMQSILQKALSLNLLSEHELELIQINLVSFLPKRIDRYTYRESSSVKIETAQKIMQSILFTISIYLKSLNDPIKCINIIKENNSEELYNNGLGIIKIKVNDSKTMLNLLTENCIITDNIAYNDTINHGLPDFFLSYDMEFGANEGNGSIDYPLCNDKMDTVGIEYISEYIEKLYLENEFCKLFPWKSVECLLNSSHKDFNDLLINIFQLILTNSFGAALLKKEPASLDISIENCLYLQSYLSDLSFKDYTYAASEAITNLISELNITDKKIIQYIHMSFPEILKRLAHALKLKQLQTFFIVSSSSERKSVEFKDDNRMENDDFKALTENIRNCNNINEKLNLITACTQSFEDLVDILNAYCIFDDEYHIFFNILSNIELAMLLKKLPPEIYEDLNLTYNIKENINLSRNEKEWQSQFILFLKEMEQSKLNEIKSFSDNLNII